MELFSIEPKPLQTDGALNAPASASSGGGDGGAMPPVPPPAAVGAAPAPIPKPSSPKPSIDTSGMFSNLRVSLMPSDLEGRPAPKLAQRLLVLGIVFMAETVVIGVLYFVTSHSLSVHEAERLALEQQIVKIDQEVVTLEAATKPAVTYQYQLANAKQVLDQHVYWSVFFDFLEKNTLNNIQYVNFSGDINSGVFSVDCLGRTFRDVALQIVSLREHPAVLEVMSSSASSSIAATGEVGGVTFAMNVRLKPEAWHKMLADAGVASPAPAPVVPAPVTVPVEEPATPTPVDTPPPEAAATGGEVPVPDAPVTPAVETPPSSLPL